jgi:hypothetical protein
MAATSTLEADAIRVPTRYIDRFPFCKLPFPFHFPALGDISAISRPSDHVTDADVTSKRSVSR